jgi:NADPH2:quinone reductase
MRAAWYEQQGPAEEVLIIGDMLDPEPGPGEVRIRVRASGVNPGDIKKREGWLGLPISAARIIPHSDGAGTIDAVGTGVDTSRIGARVWCWGAQSGRPFGTAAERVVVPAHQSVRLPESVTFAEGACLGIPGITAHRAVFAEGSVAGRTVLVAGAAGAVGAMAAQLAAWGGAQVLATVRDRRDEARVRTARVYVLGEGDVRDAILRDAPGGVTGSSR